MQTFSTKLGKYELYERLGRGGMAEVWKAFDPQLRREVAIKILHPDLLADPEFMARFEQEAQVIASLRHPNIIQVYDFHSARPSESKGPFAYMVMEYIEGETLADFINSTSRQGKFLPAGDIVSLFTGIAKAIDYAHQHGVIHRDIKPSNILLSKHMLSRNVMNEPVLSDFGIARLLGTPSGVLTRRLIGTAHYLSPEQGCGHSGNERSDIYALGIILYEICTGVRPFQGENEIAIIMQHINTIPKSPLSINPNIPPALNEVILNSLAKDPAQRFPSASAMVAAIAEALTIPAPQALNQSACSTAPHPPLNPLSSGETTLTSGEGQCNTITSQTIPTAKPAQLVHRKVSRPLHRCLTRKSISRFALSITLLLLLVGSGLTFQFLTANQVVGHFSFLSSGQFNGYSDHGINDEIQINLHNIADPSPGKSYYAWLVENSYQSETASLLLGRVIPDRGSAHFLYTEPQHQDLLSSYSALLLTEENINPVPIGPSPDPYNWHFLAQIPQMPDPKSLQHYSLFDHLRHLLSKDPDLQKMDLPGGLGIWLYQNTQEISGLAGTARDDWNNQQADDLRNQIIRLLAYLDGNALVRQELPYSAYLSINAHDTRDASIGLMGSQNNELPSYLTHINMHLNGISEAPGATEEIKQSADQISSNLNQVGLWLEQAHKDALTLIKMNDAQLLSTSSQSILNDLAAQTDYAYYGRFDQANREMHEGVGQIYVDIQHLATFDIMPYPSK